MNGVPVYPVPQNGERPYPEGRKVVFSTPGFGAFSASCSSPDSSSHPLLLLVS